MPRVRFEPTIPAFKRTMTVHALDRVTTVIGNSENKIELIKPHCRKTTRNEGSCFLGCDTWRTSNHNKIYSTKNDWATLVPMINLKSVMKLGFVLEWIYSEQYSWSFIEILRCVQYIIYLNYPKRLVCSHVSELRVLLISFAQERSMKAKAGNVVHAG
jgi:hypothetical protein